MGDWAWCRILIQLSEMSWFCWRGLPGEEKEGNLFSFAFLPSASFMQIFHCGIKIL